MMLSVLVLKVALWIVLILRAMIVVVMKALVQCVLVILVRIRIFFNTISQVAAGFDNGDIKIFDLRTMTIYWETHVSTGVCSVAFDRYISYIFLNNSWTWQGSP